jgi:hypothetical protein
MCASILLLQITTFLLGHCTMIKLSRSQTKIHLQLSGRPRIASPFNFFLISSVDSAQVVSTEWKSSPKLENLLTVFFLFCGILSHCSFAIKP